VATGTLFLLGAFAGLTIYLGLPFAFLKRLPLSVKLFLNMLATGILLFLFYDVIGKASEPIDALISALGTHPQSATPLMLDVALVIVGLIIGLIGLVTFQKWFLGRIRVSATAKVVAETQQSVLAGVKQNGAVSVGNGSSSTVAVSTPESVITTSVPQEPPAYMLALLIAVGIGLHNFSEGLAIGQSAAAGALQLATILLIGFGLHNMTEGFGIAGPLTGQKVTWQFIVLLGLIGGGPTFLGTVVGTVFHSTELFIFCLALAAGAILYVVIELLGAARRYKNMQQLMMWGLLLGFLLGYLSDLIVTYAGA
jgi:ZIP family zinc transporter